MENEILVSILCLAFNHQDYIRSALDGFLLQKTNFKFEVLINDDCSADSTATIIRDYALKFPDIVRPIFQTENQYSQDVDIVKTILFPKAKGKYIALCEGDDYWIDENKLQIQVDYMESHKDCSFCFTNALVYDILSSRQTTFIKAINGVNENNLRDLDLNLGEILKTEFIPTASFMFRKASLNELPNEFYLPCPGGDRQMALFFTALGYAHFINLKTSIYRKNVKNSIMSSWKTFNAEVLYKNSEQFLNMYKSVDNFTNNKYQSEFQTCFERCLTDMLLSGYNKKLRKNKEFKDCYKRQKLRTKIKIILAEKTPKLYSFIKNRKN